MNPAPPLCLDCGAARVGPHCHQCGQGEVDVGAGVRQLVGGAARDAFSWDERALRTLRVLVSRPGALSVAWAEGKRTRFVPPLRLFLTLGAVLVGLGVLYKWGVPPDLRPERPDPDMAARMEPTTRNASYWLSFGVVRLGLNAVLLLVPLVGFAYFVLFNLRRPQLAPHLVHALHVGCVAVLGLIGWRVAALVWLLTRPSETLGDAIDASTSSFGPVEWLLLAWLVGVTAYAFVSIRQFYQTARWRAALAAPLVVAIPLATLFGALIAIYMALLIL